MVRKLTAEQSALLAFIRKTGVASERDVQLAFATGRPGQWLTIRHRLESLEARGLITWDRQARSVSVLPDNTGLL